MFGNFPVNDDWIFVRQIEAFSKGIYTLSAELDPSFITQGFLGLLWTKFFGVSFLSLQILTFIVTLLAIYGFYLLLGLLRVSKNIRIVSAILLFFNPIIFTSAFSFMTENYFLFYSVYALYFYIKFLHDDEKLSYLIVGSLFTFLAILTRQVGIFIGIAFIFSYFFQKRDIKKLVVPILFILVGLYISYSWPKFGANRMFILFEQIPHRLHLMLLSWHYFPAFIFPFGFGLLNKRFRPVVLLLLAYYLYAYDIFPVGNVLYIEKLYTKSNFKSNFSLFDNVYFKIIYSMLLAGGIIPIILSGFKKVKLDSINMFLSLVGVFNFLILTISSDFYERYLITPFVCFFIIFVRTSYAKIKLNRVLGLTSLLFVFVSVVLQQDSQAVRQLKWQQVEALSDKTGLISQIVMNDTYIHYAVSKDQEDYTGLIERKESYEKKCFVQEYTTETSSAFIRNLEKYEAKLEGTLLEKRKPYLSKKKNISRAKNNSDKFIYDVEYPSLIFNLVGKKAHVASWCIDDEY